MFRTDTSHPSALPTNRPSSPTQSANPSTSILKTSDSFNTDSTTKNVDSFSKKLPTEIILQILTHIENASTLASLSDCSRRFRVITTDYIKTKWLQKLLIHLGSIRDKNEPKKHLNAIFEARKEYTDFFLSAQKTANQKNFALQELFKNRQPAVTTRPYFEEEEVQQILAFLEKLGSSNRARMQLQLRQNLHLLQNNPKLYSPALVEKLESHLKRHIEPKELEELLSSLTDQNG
jgi:hypothetical protein